MKKTPIGEILLERKLITETQLAHALSLQQRNGSRLGDILIGASMVGYDTLYRALAEHHALPCANLLKEPPDTALLRKEDADSYLRLQLIPWKKTSGQTVIAVCDPTDDVKAWIKQRFGEHTQCVITSPFDIQRTVARVFGDELETSSRLSLWHNLPLYSARITMLPHHRRALYALLAVALAVTFSFPLYAALALMIVCNLAYGATMLFKCFVFSKGMTITASKNWTKRLASIDERQLPIYTILIPMYQEAAILPGLLEAMKNLDYPASKLDIKLLLEEDDTATLDALYTLKPDYRFDIIRIPPGTPRTKPRACNYALRFARGEFITVFDADDKPERLQLKKAVYMFRTLPSDIICLQARLNYYNAGENLLTRFFSLEYTLLFRFMLYGLEKIGIPIPLGGTSNHIALARLKSLGEWDPYNVTEDADLGTRLAARGFRTAMLDSYTMEEATNAYGPWIRQRSRWIKGYMQTWLVHMRDPVDLVRTLGLKSFIGFQFFVGLSSLTFLTAPLVWGISALWFFGIAQAHHVWFPTWLAALAWANLGLNLLMHWYSALYCAKFYRQQPRAFAVASLLYPLYLALHSIASYKALWQLITRPHFWEKTVHGVAGKTGLAAAESDLLAIPSTNRSDPVDETVILPLKSYKFS